MFDVQLGGTVWVDRRLRKVFDEWQGVWLTIGGAGRGKDKFAHPGVGHGKEELNGIADVIFVVFERHIDGLPYIDERREVHHDFNFIFFEDVCYGTPVAEVLIEEGDIICDSSTMPVD